jgi:hypothetical protein
VIARRNRTGLARALVLGLCACTMATAAQTAGAQMGGFGGWGESMAPDFNRRDITLMVEGLRLDETQRLILETLFEGYEDDFSAKADEFRERMDALRENMRPSEEREAAMRAARDRFESMRQSIRVKQEALEQEHNGDIPEEVEEKFREEVRAHFQTLRDEMRDQGREWFQDSMAQDMFGKLAPLTEEWNRAKNHLRDQFVGDLNAQLTEDQAELWPGVDRLVRRTKSLQRGRISGESADLFQIVRSLNLSAEQQATIQPILNQYEVELDTALKQRDEYLENSRADMLRAMQTMDSEDGLAVVEKQTKLRAQVRDVNDRFALSIQQALESPTAEKFRDEHRVRAYPRVFEPTRTERVLSAAAALKGLEPEIAEAVAEMKTSYLAEVTARNESLLSAVRKHEPENAVRFARRMAARFTNQEVVDEADPLEDAMDERQSIGERYHAQLTALLTEEQVALLPMPRDDDRRGRLGDGPRGDWRGGEGRGGDWRRGDGDGERRPRGQRGGRGDGGDDEPSQQN